MMGPQINPITDTLLAYLIISPFERIKILMQTSKINPYLTNSLKPKTQTFLPCIKFILKREGLKGLWRGAPLTALSAALYYQFPLGMTARNMERYVANSHIKKDNNIPLTGNGSLRGFGSSPLGKSVLACLSFCAIYHPIMVVKTNQMAQIGGLPIYANRWNKSRRPYSVVTVAFKIWRMTTKL
jgi:hypothetical protein